MLEPPPALAVPDHPAVLKQLSAPDTVQVTVVEPPIAPGLGLADTFRVGTVAVGIVLVGVPPAARISASTVARNDWIAGYI